LQIPGQICALDRGYLSLTHLFGVNAKLRTTKFASQATKNIAVSYNIGILTDDYFVLSPSTHLTDEQMDRQTDRKATARA